MQEEEEEDQSVPPVVPGNVREARLGKKKIWMESPFSFQVTGYKGRLWFVGGGGGPGPSGGVLQLLGRWWALCRTSSFPPSGTQRLLGWTSLTSK